MLATGWMCDDSPKLQLGRTRTAYCLMCGYCWTCCHLRWCQVTFANTSFIGDYRHCLGFRKLGTTFPPSVAALLLPVKRKHSVIPDAFALLCKVCVTQNSTTTNRLRDYQAINCSSILRSASKFMPNFLLYSSMISAIRAGSTVL